MCPSIYVDKQSAIRSRNMFRYEMEKSIHALFGWSVFACVVHIGKSVMNVVVHGTIGKCRQSACMDAKQGINTGLDRAEKHMVEVNTHS